MVTISGTLSDKQMKRLLTAGYASRLTDEELVRLVWVWSESSDLTPDQVAQLQELLHRFQKSRSLLLCESAQTEETQRLFLAFVGVCAGLVLAYATLSYFLGW